jgi:hypothetical protein
MCRSCRRGGRFHWLAFFDVGDNQFILKVANTKWHDKGSAITISGWYSWRGCLAHEAAIQSDGVNIAPVSARITLFLGSDNGLSTPSRWCSLLFCEGPVGAPIHVIPLVPAVAGSDRRKVDGEGLLGWWSDGSLFEIRAPSHPEGPPQDELWRLPLDGSPPEPLGVTGTNIVYASVTSDGKRIAYNTQTWGQELWLLKPLELQ